MSRAIAMFPSNQEMFFLYGLYLKHISALVTNGVPDTMSVSRDQDYQVNVPALYNMKADI